MTWRDLFRHRPVAAPLQVVITHKIPALKALADAIKYAADQDHHARIEAARYGRTDLKRSIPKKEMSQEPPEWVTWRAEHPEVDEIEAAHLRWAYDVLRGVEKVPDEKRREAIFLYDAAMNSAYDLPLVDGRAILSPESEG